MDVTLTTHDDPRTGRIIAHHGKLVVIDISGETAEFKPPRRENWVVGDVVIFARDRPIKLAPRRNELARINPHKNTRQVLTANLDRLVIVTSAGESFSPALVDRFAVAASHAGIDAMIVFNKTDLPVAGEQARTLSCYQSVGFQVHHVSALTGDGLGTLAGALKNMVSAMVGHSGVGKTSLLNRLVPGVQRTVGALVKATGKGRHTTTSSLMVNLPGGGALIDSPGIRMFEPVGLCAQDVAKHFPGLARFAGQCRFRDCLHISEPDCAALRAVEDGLIDRERYLSYARLLESLKQSAGPAWRRHGQGRA